jgi:sigma-B regulation protein RsbU (phosphoserine phosphatase)
MGAGRGPPPRIVLGSARAVSKPRAFPLRIHISTLFLALIAGAGLVVGGYGFVATSRLLLSAGDEEFLHVAERTTGQVRNLLAPGRLLVQLLARHRITRTASLEARLESLPFLATALAEQPHISAVYVGFSTGDFFLLRTLGDSRGSVVGAPPGASFLVQSRARGEGRYLFLDATLSVIKDEPRPDYRFDPRARGWYLQAQATGAPVRTSPYVFFTTREVGTTLAQRSADGAAVIGADITLRTLSRELSGTRVTPSAQVALVDPEGFVIAHPRADRLVQSTPGGGAGLVRLVDLGDPALASLVAADVPPDRGTPLSIDGHRWVGVKRTIEADTGEPLTLLLAAPRDELVAGARGLAQRQVLIGLGVLGLTLGLVWLFARWIARPLETLARSVDRIGRGDLDTPLPEIWNPLEVGALRDVTERMRGLLKGHIEERAVRLADEQRRARELEIAGQIQQSMLPSPPREALDGRYVVAATLQPAREVGGDLYDFFLLDGRRLVFVIGDVADKGVPAALLMARVTGLFRAIARSEAGPDSILRELDARLSQGNDACMFVTAGCGQLDGETGELRYASAGHELPILRRLDGTTTVLAAEGGPALGLDTKAEFPLWTGRLAPGDALVLWTDGATEAFDAAGNAFGLERLQPVVAATPAEALGTLPARLVEAVEQFSAGGGPRDDLAMLLVQYRPPDVELGAGAGECWRTSVASEPEDMARAQRRIEAILRARHVPSETVHDCTLAAEEVMANIAEHAYAGRSGLARVEIRLLAEEIQLRFEDSGPPFNPLEQPAPDLDASLAERRVGGLGILLIRRLVDRCEYAREGSTNVLTMSRRRPPEPAEAPGAADAGGESGATTLEIEIADQEPAGRRVTLRGRLDTATAPELEAALLPLLDSAKVSRLTFHLEGLAYVSSAGVRSLVRAHRLVAGRGGRMAIVGPQPRVRRVLEILKVVPPGHVFASELDLAAAGPEPGPRS